MERSSVSLDFPLEEADDAPGAEEEAMPPVELRQVAVFKYGTCTLDPHDDDAL
jgi:hypothetical protein